MHHLLNYTSGGYLDFFLESMDQIAGACGMVLKYLNRSSYGTLKHCNMCFYGAEMDHIEGIHHLDNVQGRICVITSVKAHKHTIKPLPDSAIINKFMRPSTPYI